MGPGMVCLKKCATVHLCVVICYALTDSHVNNLENPEAVFDNPTGMQ